MDLTTKKKMTTLLRREIQEYRNSFVLTPVLVALVLLFFMLASVFLADRVTVVGDSIMNILADEHTGGGLNITLSIDGDDQQQDYVVVEESISEEEELEDWNFSREWTFNPPRKEKTAEDLEESIESLNPVLNALHCLFLLLLLATSANYLLGTFHHDRRDHSVLFWKSMPVSEWDEVAAKMATVCLVAPVIYLAVSMLTQLASVLVGMLMAWRMEMSPMKLVMGNLDFLALFRGQLSGMLIWVLWAAPFYAWLLLASSAARRSPLLLALAIPLGLIVIEELFIDSDYLSTSFSRHVPHPGSDDAGPLGFYFYEPGFSTLDYVGMLLGLLVMSVLLLITVWFRKHRFES